MLCFVYTRDLVYVTVCRRTPYSLKDALSRIDLISEINFDAIAEEQTTDEELQQLLHNNSLKFKPSTLPSGKKFDIKKQVREWAKACIRCQKCKVSRHTKSQLGEFEQPNERFSVVHIDLIGKLPPSEGMQYCLTCIDRFSCRMEAIPIPEIKAKIVGRAFYEKWICRTLKGAIKAHNNIRWTESLPTVLLGLRAAIRPDISYTIAQMVYGTSIKLPGEFFDPPTINMDPRNFVAKLQQHMAELKPLKSPSNRKQNIFVHKDRLQPAYLLAVDNQTEQTSVGKKNDISNWKEPSPLPDEQPTTSCGRKIKKKQ
ncbi:retrovirus-related Pol polyprotein from transposon opus [Trichonephila clavipes]|nr:retrovirus-related Pol polyprotein from transposon opus [Trichonephila clavipes]